MSEILRDLEGAIAVAQQDLHALRITGDDDVAEVETVLARLEVAETRLAALRLQLLGEAQLAGAARVADGVRNSPRTATGEANAALRLGRELRDRFWILADALATGMISQAQAEAIIHGLKRIPIAIGRAQLEHCQHELLTYCHDLGPAELRAAALRMWELLDPEGADDVEARRLAQEERRARAGRAFRLTPDFHGSLRVSGQLPVADAALLQAQLEALMPSASSYGDDGGAIPAPDARRADALMLLATLAANTGAAPEHGGDRPHVHVTLPLTLLTDGLGRAELPALDGESISAGEARRLACDAGLIPIVLGSHSQPLDVGREHRLVTKALRAALVFRDRGCVFPHCTASPATCEAHHLVPWWAGGATSLSNMVLLCPHHHRLVEPDPKRSPDVQWQVHVDTTGGEPVFLPPRYLDPARRPRRHRRFKLHAITAPPPSKASMCSKPAGWHPPPTPEPANDPWHPQHALAAGRT